MVHRVFITDTSTVRTYHLLTLGRLSACARSLLCHFRHAYPVGQHKLRHFTLYRDLETKIDQEQSRVSSNNHERIKQDLEAIAQENAQLVAQIKVAAANKGHK
jgi:hypothetical protein